METNAPRNPDRTQTTGSYALKVRWQKAEEALQRAWDADNRRSTERTQMRTQRAWDAAQRAKHAYAHAINALGASIDGYVDGYEPEDVDAPDGEV